MASFFASEHVVTMMCDGLWHLKNLAILTTIVTLQQAQQAHLCSPLEHLLVHISDVRMQKNIGCIHYADKWHLKNLWTLKWPKGASGFHKIVIQRIGSS